MTEKMLKVVYRCEHPSCQVFCKKGSIYVGEEEFDELKAAYDEEGVFRSPRDICRMGFSQPFKAVKVSESTDADSAAGEEGSGELSSDPIGMLKQEHIKKLELVEAIEAHLRKRDVDALWKSAAELEDFIMLHSVKKEEGILFPMLADRLPMGDAYMHIVHEDHKEFFSLLYSFRGALQEDDILDGIIKSVLVNIKNHIRKEDEEFFVMIADEFNEEDRKKLSDLFAKVEAIHEPFVIGKRSEKLDSPYQQNKKEMDFEIQSVKNMGTTDDWSCH